ncbi:MAG TPA: dihydrolipoamide acetyltransferase family protein [Chloroflexota bacterium]|nr:dihydrolipoamide acetyltransferase family protein [Chloroflexota bacterium]
MVTEVKMPRLSLTMEVGTVVQWLKSVGDPVAKGEELAEIETDKVNVAMEAPANGFLRSLLIGAGVAVPCDTLIALLSATADEPLSASDSPPTPGVPAAGPSAAAASPLSEPAPAPALLGTDDAVFRPHVNASPAAKNLARELGVDLTMLTGSGPGGRIGLEDVRQAADGPVTTPVIAGSRAIPLTKMRQAIAQRMVLSTSTAPQFSVQRRLDMGAALRFLQGVRTEATVNQRAPGIIDLIHLAVIRALHAHPEVNAGYQAGEPPAIVLHDSVNLGIAVTLPEGLIVPVIQGAERLGLAALAQARFRLQDEARGGRLSANALSGATITVSNLGPMGVDQFTAIVNPPEAAILAVGGLRNIVVSGPLREMSTITVTVTADHRVLDGAQIARFLETLAETLDHLDTVS